MRSLACLAGPRKTYPVYDNRILLLQHRCSITTVCFREMYIRNIIFFKNTSTLRFILCYRTSRIFSPLRVVGRISRSMPRARMMRRYNYKYVHSLQSQFAQSSARLRRDEMRSRTTSPEYKGCFVDRIQPFPSVRHRLLREDKITCVL